MGPATKQQALEKLKGISNKIGYPDQWKDYSALTVERGDLVGNRFRANEWAFADDVRKIGKDADKTEWSMTPPTVNAYYSPLMNNINFPAGILQPPFFALKGDDAVNFGAIGAVIGHELTHGFDDSGRRFDARGNLRDWWTGEDAKRFDELASCVVKQYGEYPTVGELKVNGKLTLGENIADLGGLRIAYLALMDSLDKQQKARKVDGFTPEQRFFLGWGQVWCQNITPEAARLRTLTDPHSPGNYRVNGVVSNLPEFQKAFGCRANQPMVRGDGACRIW